MRACLSFASEVDLGWRVRLRRVALLCVALLAAGDQVPAVNAHGSTADVATGRSGKGSDVTRLVLHGRRLTITLPRSIAVVVGDDTDFEDPPPLRRNGPPLPVGAWCGDDASFDSGSQPAKETWADVTRATLRVARSTRTIRVLFPRDITRRVNQCGFVVRPGSYYATGRSAAMVLRRGTRVGCRPNRRERVILRKGRVRVTLTRQNLDEHSFQTAYRACLAPKQALRPIETGGVFSGGSSGGSRRPVLFRAAGSWLAWTNIEFRNSQGHVPPGISELDLRAKGRRPSSFNPAAGPGYYGGGQVTQLTIAPGGTLAWILDQQRGAVPPHDIPPFPTLLHARHPGGKRIRLDQAPSATQLGAPTIGPDHRTITWTHDGMPRSYTLPP